MLRLSVRIGAGLSNLALLLTSLIVVLGVVELLLRTTHLSGARIAWTSPDPVLGYRPRPGARYWSTQESDHPITGRINRFGWRDVDWSLSKPAGGYRVAVIGDSFVEALQVEQDSTFLTLTQAALSAQLGRPVELMNFGRSGFTQSEELLVLQHEVLQFKPDLVVVFFFPGNDVADVSPQTASTLQRPFFRVRDARLVLDTSFTTSRMYKLRSRVDALKRHSALVSMLAERFELWRRNRPAFARTELEAYIAFCTHHPPRASVDGYGLNKRLLQEMEHTLALQGIQFGIVVVPLPSAVKHRIGALDSTFDAHCYEKDLAEFANARAIGILGLEDVIERADTEEAMPLYWRGIGHWTYAGHRVVAGALAAWLRPLIMGQSAREQAIR